MDRRAVVAATKLRVGLAAGIVFVMLYALVRVGGKEGMNWQLSLIVSGAAALVFLVSAVVRIVHYVYDEW